jgi:hypothetical protein
MRHGARRLPRREFCFCCLSGAALAATGVWLTPQQAFAEARGLVSLIKDSAATSPIVSHRCGATSPFWKDPAETWPS